jgi:hypothetical protein
MSSGNWLNNDGLYLQYGTAKATPEVGGDYQMFGPNRCTEVVIDLTTLTSTAAIQSNTSFFPDGANMYVEQIEVVCEVAGASGTSFSVGLIQTDRATIPANYSTAFVNAMVLADVTYVGQKTTLTEGSTYAGLMLGASSNSGTYPASATGPYYITALSSGTFTTGKVRVRIFWHGIGTISQ